MWAASDGLLVLSTTLLTKKTNVAILLLLVNRAIVESNKLIGNSYCVIVRVSLVLKELLLVTDVSTTCAEAVFRVK